MGDINDTNIEKQKEADFITIVSSEMIAEVMQAHFNKHMYKKEVEIVDLKATETGYMFSLAFVHVQSTVQSTKKHDEVYHREVYNGNKPWVGSEAYEDLKKEQKRDGKGKFISKE